MTYSVILKVIVFQCFFKAPTQNIVSLSKVFELLYAFRRLRKVLKTLCVFLGCITLVKKYLKYIYFILSIVQIY